jgi:dolichol kinase
MVIALYLEQTRKFKMIKRETIPFLTIFPVRVCAKSDLHLVRKFFHLFSGVLVVYLYSFCFSKMTIVMCLGSMLGLNLLVEGLRLRSPTFNRKVLPLVAPIMRAHEKHQWSTIPHYLAASIISILLFPKAVAILSILYLACGDPMASLFGILYGKFGPALKGGKSLIGTIAGVVTCTIITLVFLGRSVSGFQWILVSLVGGLAGGLVELLPFEMDDNFTIPVVSGFVLWLAFMILGL